jgi:hypothetical protein
MINLYINTSTPFNKGIFDFILDLKTVIKKGIFMVMSNYSDLLRGDRVRARTPPEINQEIDIETAAIVRFYSGKTDYEISRRIEDLDNEWDIGRIVEVRAATVSLIGVILGLKRGKKWLILPTIASTFLLQYAIQGWCPPVSLLRRFGFRTRLEIDLEKYALQALRGDSHHGEHHEHHREHHGEHHEHHREHHEHHREHHEHHREHHEHQG